jgi:hypothetical protein
MPAMGSISCYKPGKEGRCSLKYLKMVGLSFLLGERGRMFPCLKGGDFLTHQKRGRLLVCFVYVRDWSFLS